MKYLGLIVLVMLHAGCAIVDAETTNAERREKFTPIETVADSYRVEHGIVTVSQVQPRSDIVILPPSMQHVVWRREEPARAVAKDRQAEAAPAASKKSISKKRRPRDNWPLLAEDMNFDSEKGRVDMCDPIDVCEPGEFCPDLTPCERKDELSCFRVKQGDYCVENEE